MPPNVRSKTMLIITFILTSYLLGLVSAQDKQQKQPPIVKLDDDHYRIGKVMIDSKKREVIVKGLVNMTSGLVEYLACAPGGKLHESVLALNCRPLHLQLALILIGLEAKGGFKYQGDPTAPKGDPVEMWVEWAEDGKNGTKRVRAEKLILNLKTKKAMKDTSWIFTGSAVWEGVFLADTEKSIIATYHDPAAIINNPLPDGADDTVYGVNSEVVPGKGTPVTVIIKSMKRKKGQQKEKEKK